MKNRFYRMGQRRHRDAAQALAFASHVNSLNTYVDELRARKPGQFVPYVDPAFGGVDARLLLLNLSPGEQTKTSAHGGSGFLSVENSDPAAARINEALDHARISLDDCVPWNAHPWFVEGLGTQMPASLQDKYLQAGVDPLIQVIARLPKLRAVFVFGRATERAWTEFFGRAYPRTRRSLGQYFYHRSTGPTGYIGTVDDHRRWQGELFQEMEKAAQRLQKVG